MPVFGRSSYHYSGNESYRHIDRLIRRSRVLYIVSPYIDAHYARMLSRQSRWKKIYVLSSSIAPEARSVLGKSAGREHFLQYAVYAILVIFNYILYMLNRWSIYMLLPLAAAIVFFPFYNKISEAKLYVRKPKSFTHSKMYISEKEGIEGSANLTFAGTHRNIENIEIIKDIQELRRMKTEFWKLWDSSRPA